MLCQFTKILSKTRFWVQRSDAKEKKKWGLGKTKHGEVNSFIPLYREPSSIEKILGDAEREQHHRIHQDSPKKVQHLGDAQREHHHHHKTHQDPPKRFQQLHSPNEEPHKMVQHFQTSNREPLKKVHHFKPSKSKTTMASHRRAINPSYAQISAIKVQAAFRGYMVSQLILYIDLP